MLPDAHAAACLAAGNPRVSEAKPRRILQVVPEGKTILLRSYRHVPPRAPNVGFWGLPSHLLPHDETRLVIRRPEVANFLKSQLDNHRVGIWVLPLSSPSSAIASVK